MVTLNVGGETSDADLEALLSACEYAGGTSPLEPIFAAELQDRNDHLKAVQRGEGCVSLVYGSLSSIGSRTIRAAKGGSFGNSETASQAACS